MIQAAEEEAINKEKPIGGADMKSGSEGLRNMNYRQENYDGMTFFCFCIQLLDIKVVYLKYPFLLFVFFFYLEYALLNASA